MKKILGKIKNVTSKKVVKDYFSIAGASLLLQPIQIVKGFFVANILGPADYGILKTVELVQMLSKFGNLGFKTVANREMSHALGEKDYDSVEKYRNTNYTAEIILSIILTIVGIVSAFFFESYKISILLVLASISLFASKVLALLRTESAIQKKFKLLSVNNLYVGFAISILVILITPYLKIYTIFLVNIIVFSFGIYFLRKSLTFPFSFTINNEIFRKSLKIGIPFTIATLTLGLYKYSERILLVEFISATALGFFSFALMISNSITILFKASIKVRIQDIWRLVGAKEFKRLNKMVIKESLILTCFAILLIPFIWLGADFFIPIFLPKYTEAIPIIRVTTLIIPFQVIANYAGAVVTSKTVNKIYVPITLRLISLIVFAGGAYYYYLENNLTLEVYAYLNLAGYAFYNLALLLSYYKSFNKVYLNNLT